MSGEGGVDFCDGAGHELRVLLCHAEVEAEADGAVEDVEGARAAFGVVGDVAGREVVEGPGVVGVFPWVSCGVGAILLEDGGPVAVDVSVGEACGVVGGAAGESFGAEGFGVALCGVGVVAEDGGADAAVAFGVVDVLEAVAAGSGLEVEFVEEGGFEGAGVCEECVEFAELDAEDGGGDFAGTEAVEGEGGCAPLLFVFVVAHPEGHCRVGGEAGAFEEVFVVGEEEPSFAGGEDFEVIEAPDAGVSEGANDLPVVARADGLCAVFDDGDVVLLCDVEDVVEAGGDALHVDGDDGACARCDSVREVCGVESEGFVDFGDDGHGSDGGDGSGRCDVGVGGHDDFVSGADAEAVEGADERGGAAVDGERVPDADEVCGFVFEGTGLAFGVVTEEVF
ncbi:MAG: hypothetical protein RMJ43_03850 [Chloroherpetonaceae bacterium]|nr:hypothetical protein [Chthonomonadaceae bacterium]MDW8206945.1 hypothetical protein [Chloroherpetonaceae bacterium]